MSEYRVDLVERAGPIQVGLNDEGGPIAVDVRQGEVVFEGGTKDYEELHNKPRINGVSLVGDKSSEEIGIEEISNMELDFLFNSQF